MQLSAIRVSALAMLAAYSAISAELPGRSRAGQPPRKVIVGTIMQAYWETYPGLPKRLDRLMTTIDRVAEAAHRSYGRGPDVIVLPEVAITGEFSGTVRNTAIPYSGAVEAAFARKARQHHTYLVVPLYLLEDDGKTCSNAAILVGRNGERVGTYRKVHLAVPTGSDSLEGGTTPGKEAAVFSCDFGKLGIQICFDMEYDSGWRELERQGA
ncbi:MAG TPA: carbon-nitrogen hydrolase family protein, partial [Bryobacteraceae bacterium]|nr:carbon-nitrogen hydrolase family protein [Bryobacteraceae bacterium]